MNVASMANQYKNQQAMTASPEELTLMLYNGAIRFIAESIQGIENKDLQKAHNANIRAQEIIREFRATLDMQYEIAKQLDPLYEYMEYQLVQANATKNILLLGEVKNMLQELRDTWYQAMKLARGQRAAGN
jgi:flagellar protein FliS